MRRYGKPKSDAERAANHYGITLQEYESNPNKYPLPARGSGLYNLSGFGIIAVIGLAIWAIVRGRRK